MATPLAIAGPIDDLPPMQIEGISIEVDERGAVLMWAPVVGSQYYSVYRQVDDAAPVLVARTVANAYYDAWHAEDSSQQVTYFITAHFPDGDSQGQSIHSQRGQCLYMKDRDVSVSPSSCVPAY